MRERERDSTFQLLTNAREKDELRENLSLVELVMLQRIKASRFGSFPKSHLFLIFRSCHVAFKKRDFEVLILDQQIRALSSSNHVGAIIQLKELATHK